MAVFRVERTNNYTVMSNYPLRDSPLRVVACAAGHSPVRVVPRTTDVKLSKCSSHIALAMIQVYWKQSILLGPSGATYSSSTSADRL